MLAKTNEPFMKNTHRLLGWFLSRPVHKPQRFADSMRLLSDVILSAGGCANTVHPDSLGDAMNGVEMDLLRYDFIQARSDGDSWSGLWYLNTPKGAAEVNDRCFGGSMNIYGLAVPKQYAQKLSDEVNAGRDNMSGKDTPIWMTELEGDEILLGYDVLCWNHGWTTFQCNGLEDELFSVFETKVNAWSLIDDLDRASAFARYVNDNELGEPGWWAPYAVVLSGDAQYRLDLPPVASRWENMESHTGTTEEE